MPQMFTLPWMNMYLLTLLLSFMLLLIVYFMKDPFPNNNISVEKLYMMNDK